MKRILIIQNIPREGPGLLEPAAKDAGVMFDIRSVDHALFPSSLNGYAGLVVLGGPASANDVTASMHDELRLAQEAVRRRLPYLGVCLGMQILVKAAGGTVLRAARKEVGFRTPEGAHYVVDLLEPGRMDPLFAGLPEQFLVFQLHGETVELTQDMVLLAAGNDCRNQVVRVGPCAYGIQCHFELTTPMMEEWLAEDGDLKKCDPVVIRKDFEEIGETYPTIGMQLLRNWLGML